MTIGELVSSDWWWAALPVLGWMVGGIATALVVRWFVGALIRRSGLDTLAERLGVVKLLYAVNIRAGVDRVLANMAAVAVLLVTAMVLSERLALPGVADGIGALVTFLPRLVSASIVAGAGVMAADLGARLADGFAKARKGWISSNLASNIVYFTVLAVFLTTALQHLGLDTDLVDNLIILTIGIGLASIGLSFSLGSRRVVEALLARQYAPSIAQPGDRVQIREIGGVVVRYDAITVMIRDDDGRNLMFPCSSLLRESGVVVGRLPHAEREE